jgi:hypothetical protein
VPTALRERAFFSSKVESARFLESAQQKALASVRDARVALQRADGKPAEALMTRDRFISQMRRIAQDEGLGPTGPREIEDVRGAGRLGLIYDMAEKSAYGYAQRKVGLDPNVLNAFPAQRLVRAVMRREPRDWDARWQEAGAAVGWQGAAQGDMVALKTSPIWTALSRFDVPWPPFDFGSGMGLRDVRRSEAEALGLVVPGQQLSGADADQDLNAGLEASVSDLSQDKLSWLLGQFRDRVSLVAGKLRWR